MTGAPGMSSKVATGQATAGRAVGQRRWRSLARPGPPATLLPCSRYDEILFTLSAFMLGGVSMDSPWQSGKLFLVVSQVRRPARGCAALGHAPPSRNPLWVGVRGLGGQRTKTLSLAKASSGVGSVDDPAVLALDPEVCAKEWG